MKFFKLSLITGLIVFAISCGKQKGSITERPPFRPPSSSTDTNPVAGFAVLNGGEFAVGSLAEDVSLIPAIGESYSPQLQTGGGVVSMRSGVQGVINP